MATYAASGRVGPDRLVEVTVWRDHAPVVRRTFTAGDVECGQAADWVAWVAETDAAPAEEMHP